MNFLQFLFFYFICTIILIFILLFIYRFFIRHKCNILSKIAEKQLEDYWGSFGDNKSITDIDNTDDFDKFVESIHIIDNTNIDDTIITDNLVNKEKL